MLVIVGYTLVIWLLILLVFFCAGTYELVPRVCDGVGLLLVCLTGISSFSVFPYEDSDFISKASYMLLLFMWSSTFMWVILDATWLSS